ncbi:hypothetical protein UFOVP1672_52 [uncultured Caudovirales phage]|uniref:Uncharacterized protein n=1 Tax=uncultured Caudovirales phage TaxID=2100421 RepID=A0A6J5SBL7_9CAUD|nr:hypothetical protein UFOVP988_74 [uncultured Caudovirales phage]CAB4211075.1 hypothetical protein UFOVP1425_74 [uncultured Caudovirales phage]CAB4223443.1 hypothetical protein UFOVP1672_52 [uncultured Caudovirales phage]
MNERFDVISFKESKGGKVYAVRLGSAVPNKKGDGGFSLYLDAIPAPVDGQYKMTITPPRERQREPGQDDDLDSQVPF